MNSAKHQIAIASKTVTGHYGSSTVLQQVNDQSDQQCKFLGVRTALCGVVEHLQLGVRSQNWGSVRECKNITVCNSSANSPEAAKFQNSIFSTLKMPPPAWCRPRPMPLRLLSHRH